MNNPLAKNSPALNVKEISDVYIQKNFRALQDYFSSQNQLLGFNFFEFVFPGAVQNQKIAHGLGLLPQDVIITRITGSGSLILNWANFDASNLDISATGPCRVRMFVGSYWNQQTNTTSAATDTQILNPASTVISIVTSTGTFTNPMTTLGDLIYGATAGALTRLPGDTSNNRKFLLSQSVSGLATAPQWASLIANDLPNVSGFKNYLGSINGVNNNGDFETGTIGTWGLGNVALTSNFPTGVPTFGSGASVSLTISAVNLGQLSGSWSASYSSSIATVAGDMFHSPAFTIDASDQAKVLGFKFAYKAQANAANGNWSGTSSNSFGVAIYNVTQGGSTWIMPAGVWNLVQSSGVGICSGTFQTTASDTQYRLVVFNANITSGAITVYFDDFFIGPNVATLGAAVADRRSYTPIIGNGTRATVNTENAYFGRICDVMEISYFYTQASSAGAAAGAGTYSWSLPAGYSIDINKVSANNGGSLVVGECRVFNGAVTDWEIGTVTILSTTTLALLTQTSALTGALVGSANHPFTQNNAMEYSFFARVPIVGWSSNTVVSSDTDSRVVAFRAQANGSMGVLAAAYSDVAWNTVVNDSHGVFATPNYTIQVPGYYDITAQIQFTGTNALNNASAIQILKNGTTVQEYTFVAGGAITGNVSLPISIDAVLCNTGDTIKVQAKSGATTPSYVTSLAENFFAIARRSGSTAVLATETVSCRYYSTAGTSYNNGPNTYVYATKDYDTHNAFVNNVFTAPISGKHLITAKTRIGGVGTTGQEVRLFARKNSSTLYSLGFCPMTAVNTNFFVGGTEEIQLNAGDTIDIRITTNVAANMNESATAHENMVTIVRVGN